MEFGLFIVTQYDPSRSMRGVGDELVRQTELAREGGFDGVCVGEHHATDDQYLLNEAVLAHLAEHAGDMWIGPMMSLLPYHNPVRLAEFGATLDVLSGGNLRFGAALGYRPKEYDVFGVERAEAPGRLAEGVEVIKRLWTEDGVDFEGEHFALDDVSINPKPLQEPRPPIWIGASNESSIRRAARIGDGWLGAHVPFDVAREQVEAFRDERAGADASVGLAREVFVAETAAAAEETVREHLLGKYESYSEWGQDDVIEDDRFDSAWEKLNHERFLVGDPDDVVAGIERYRDALDVDCLVVRSQFPGMDTADVHDSLRLFSEEVLPRID